MDQVFIDANIFLEVVLQDKKSAACRQYLNKLAVSGILGYTTDYILYSCLLHIEQHAKNPENLTKFLHSLRGLPTLQILHPNASVLYQTIEAMKVHHLDFDDALVVASMQYNGIKTLVSLDKDFDKVKEITRIEP